MFTSLKKIWICLGIVIFCTIFSVVFADIETQGKVSLQISGLGIRHGTPNDVHLGTLSTAPYDQEFSGQFTEPFWVEDLQGNITGHYTTIQCDGIYWPDGYIITWIYLKAGNIVPTLLQGVSGHVYIYSAFSDYISILHPLTYMYKPTDVFNGGLTNKYGDMPRFKLIIPANAPAWSYSGTLTFSFYMD